MRCAVALLAFVTLQRLGELIWGLRTPGACSPLSEVLRASYDSIALRLIRAFDRK
jgi:hypothetical protein